MANIDTLKTLLQISDNSQDTLLEALLDQCEAEYLHRTHQSEADDPIVIEMTVERYNSLGNEGISQMNYSGISESYFSDYSEKVQKLIRSKTRMVTL
jgi:hypothetical protein